MYQLLLSILEHYYIVSRFQLAQPKTKLVGIQCNKKMVVYYTKTQGIKLTEGTYIY